MSERRRQDAERDRLLAEARRQAAELDAIFDTTTDGPVVCGPDGRVLRANDAPLQRSGLPAFEVGESVVERLAQTHPTWPDGRELQRDEMPVVRALRGEVVKQALVGFHLPGPRPVWCSVSAAPIRVGEQIEGAVVTISDVTERWQAAEALREADRNKTEFLAVLSHELRNPLAPIRNSIYVLEHADPQGPQADRARAVIDRQVRQLTRLVDDLLDVTRLSRGRVRLRRERLDLNAAVRRTADDHRSVFERGGVELSVVTAEEPLEVSADLARLAQMVGNLLQNAAKFTPRGGHASVCVERRGDTALVRVRDDGVGIAPEMLPRLFEPFVQSEDTLDRPRGGLGLGLALVSGLAELHGGRASASSEGPGHGAEFVIELRVEGPREHPAPPAAEAPARTGRRVLVIEDNVDAAESLREALQLNAHVVDVAYNGTEGVAKARRFRPDVVLCDIGLPGMTGYEVARALRSDPELRSIEVVALSGYSVSPESIREAGFGGYLSKPPDMATLEKLIAETERDRRY